MSASVPEPVHEAQAEAAVELERISLALRTLHSVGYYDDNPPLRSCAWGCSTCKSKGACATLRVLDGIAVEEATSD